MITIDDTHIFSATRGCSITAARVRDVEPHSIQGITAVLAKDGNHTVFDGNQHHSVGSVVFAPSIEWATAVANDPNLFNEAQEALNSWRGWLGVDVDPSKFVKSGSCTLRGCIDNFILQGVPIL